jgi:hypothetical protein
MYSSRKKIQKDNDVEPIEFEDTVAQYLFDLENTNKELKSDLKDLYINSDGYFWKPQSSGDICSLQIAEVLPQDSSSPCQGTGEKIQCQLRMLFCLLPAGLYDHQRKDLPLRDHAPAQIRKVNKPLFWLGKTGVNRGPGSLYLSPTANSFQISPSLSLVLVHFPCANGTKNHTLAATVLPIGSLLFNGSTELLYMGSLLSRNHTFSLTHNGQQRETWEPIFFPCKSHICSTESLVC